MASLRSWRALGTGTIVVYLSLVVLIPLASVAWESASGGWGGFWSAVTNPQALAALRLTLGLSGAVALLNAVTGTLIAWVLVRDDFPGKGLMDAVIDLPFSLPTIVAGLTLLTLYGPESPLGINVAYTRVGVLLSLLFVTLPFVVRSVQPVLQELDRSMEEAAASLGAGHVTIFRRIVLPNILPAVLSGAGLGFSRSLGEFGAVVLISGNVPFRTQMISVNIYGLIESDNVRSAAALSLLLLVLSALVMLAMDWVRRWRWGHER